MLTLPLHILTILNQDKTDNYYPPSPSIKSKNSVNLMNPRIPFFKLENWWKKVGLRSMRVKYKEKNFSLCQNCSDISLAMGLPTSSGFIKFKKTPNSIKLSHKKTFCWYMHKNINGQRKIQLKLYYSLVPKKITPSQLKNLRVDLHQQTQCLLHKNITLSFPQLN